MADICTATVTVKYNKKDKNIDSVEIDKKEDFLKCVTGEAKSVTASAVEQTGSQESKVGDGTTMGEAYRQTIRQGGRRRKSRRGKRSGRKSKRRSSKKARKSKKSKRRRGKKSKRRRRRK